MITECFDSKNGLYSIINLIKIINNSKKEHSYEKFEKYVKIKKTTCDSRCL